MKIRNSVVVITGGSSGIGLATAMALARKGAKLVLVARREDGLLTAAAELDDLGAEVITVSGDVADPSTHQQCLTAALQRFGRVDVWINNASLGVWGWVEQIPFDEFERVNAVNYLAVVYGSKTVLPHFEERGNGTLINVASGLAERAIPLFAPYCAAKAATKSFTDSLRLELRSRGSAIKVVSILPAAIDTPFYSEGKTHLRIRPHPVSAVYDARRAARAIVSAIQRPRRNVYVGGMSRMLALGERTSSRLMDEYMLQGDRMLRQQITNQPDRGQTNLREGRGAGRIDGEWGGERRRQRIRFIAAAGALTIIAGAFLATRSRS